MGCDFWGEVKMLKWLYAWGRLDIAYTRISIALPSLIWLSMIGFVLMTYTTLCLAPNDYQQGEAFRIMYVHVPAAFFSMGLYVSLATFSAIFLVWRIKLAAMMAKSCAEVGTAITFLALVTGALWGKPMWGTAWVWDARLSSELILLFLYVGYLALEKSIPDREQAQKTSAFLALIGVINLPIIHFSVVWWNTLHQGSSVLRFAKPTIAAEMLWPLFLSLLVVGLWTVTLVFLSARIEILARSQDQRWIKSLRTKGGLK